MKETCLSLPEVQKHYLEPLEALGLDVSTTISFSLKYDKPTASQAKLYLSNLLPALQSLKIDTVLVADGTYFKYLTGVSKVDPHLGYVLSCKVKGYEHINCILSLNYKVLFYDPSKQSRIDLSLTTVANHVLGKHKEIGSDIIHSEDYPDTIEEIALWLNRLHQYNALTVDIEAFSLQFNEAGIGTIAFAWDEHNGIAFCCDEKQQENYIFSNTKVKKLLREFFESFKGKLIYHNVGYDTKVLLYELFMNNLLDQKGLLHGLDVMTKNIDDTKLITYLATNSCAGNTLGLKPNTHEYSGNYSVDVTDIRLVPKQDLLRYNLVDALSTWYLYKKNYPIMVADNQLDIYNTIFIPSVKVILQMELTGMCLDMNQVLKAEQELIAIKDIQLAQIQDNPLIKKLEETLTNQAWFKDFEDRKAKAKKPENIKPREIPKPVTFNPGSPKQLIELVYNQLGFEITDRTNTGLGATGGKVLLKKYNQLLSQFNLTEDSFKLDESLQQIFEED
jgi:DNA polymerase-1